MRAKSLLVEFYDPAEDELSKSEMTDTRRPRLTLKHLNRLRKTRELQKLEKIEHDEFVTQMYDAPDEEEGGGF